MWNKTYWLALLERAVKTFAQSLAALLVVNTGVSLSWPQMLITSGLATLASVLTSLATNVATRNGPGVGSAETLNENFPEVDPVEFDEDEGPEDMEAPEGFDDGSAAGPGLNNRAN